MITVIVWLLVSVQDSNSNSRGTATLIERFPTAGDCEYVKQRLPLQNYLEARCIQAKIVVPK